MKIRVDPRNIPVPLQLQIESGARPITSLVEMLRRFGTDDDGEPLSGEAVDELISGMTLGELNDMFEQIQMELSEIAVPPRTARNSKNGATARGSRRSG